MTCFFSRSSDTMRALTLQKRKEPSRAAVVTTLLSRLEIQKPLRTGAPSWATQHTLWTCGSPATKQSGAPLILCSDLTCSLTSGLAGKRMLRLTCCCFWAAGCCNECCPAALFPSDHKCLPGQVSIAPCCGKACITLLGHLQCQPSPSNFNISMLRFKTDCETTHMSFQKLRLLYSQQGKQVPLHVHCPTTAPKALARCPCQAGGRAEVYPYWSPRTAHDGLPAPSSAPSHLCQQQSLEGVSLCHTMCSCMVR